MSLFILKAQIRILLTWSLADNECPKCAQNYLLLRRDIWNMFLEGVLKKKKSFYNLSLMIQFI